MGETVWDHVCLSSDKFVVLNFVFTTSAKVIKRKKEKENTKGGDQ